jgi:glycosyltransferase involved in cell wall biosynthesis
VSESRRRLRLGFSCHDAFPSNGANTQQIFWTLSELARLDADVTLIVPALDERSGSDRESIARHYGAHGDITPSSFTVRATGAGVPAGSLARGRFDWTVPRHLKSGAYDLVWTRDPVAAAACVRARLPTVFETFRPDFATRRRFAVWRKVCLHSRHLRGLVLHSRTAADAFVAAGVDRARCLVAYNGFAPATMEPQLDRAAARARTGLPPGVPLVVYAGHATREKGMAQLVGTAAAIPEARFVIVGVDPASRQGTWIDAAARAAGATNITLRPFVRLADVAPYLYAADCLVIPPYDEPDRPHRRGMLPIKVFSYLAAGRAIVAPRLPDLEEVLTDGRTARLVPPLDVAATARAIGSLIGDEDQRERLERNARAMALKYTWEARARKLAAFFHDRLDADASRQASTQVSICV